MIFLLQFTLLAIVSSFGKQVKCFFFTSNYNLEVSLLEYLIKTAISIPYQLSMNANSNRVISLLFILSTQYIIIFVDQWIVDSNWFVRYFMFEGFTVVIMPIYMHFSLHLGSLYYKSYLKIYLSCYLLSVYLFYYVSIDYRGPIECILFIMVSVYSYLHSLYLDYLEKTEDYIYYNEPEYKNESILVGKKQKRALNFVQIPSTELLASINSRNRRNQQNQLKILLKDVIYIGNYKGNHSVIQIYEKNIFIIKSILFHKLTLTNYTAEQIFSSFNSSIQSFQFDKQMRVLIIYRTLQEYQGQVLVYPLSNLSKPIKIFTVAHNPQQEVDIDTENKLFYYIDSNNNLIETSYVTSISSSYKICEGFFRYKIKVFNSPCYKVLVCYKYNTTRIYLASLINQSDYEQTEIYMQKQNINILIKQIFSYEDYIVVVTDTLTYLFNPLTLKVSRILKDFHNFIKMKKTDSKLIITQTVEREDQFIIDNLNNPQIQYSCSNVVNLAFLGDQKDHRTKILLFLQNDKIDIIQNIWADNHKQQPLNNNHILEQLKT